jgi:hypothetical protein
VAIVAQAFWATQLARDPSRQNRLLLARGGRQAPCSGLGTPSLVSARETKSAPLKEKQSRVAPPLARLSRSSSKRR